MRWSDDQLKSNYHRVRMPAPGEDRGSRYSIAYFNQAGLPPSNLHELGVSLTSHPQRTPYALVCRRIWQGSPAEHLPAPSLAGAMCSCAAGDYMPLLVTPQIPRSRQHQCSTCQKHRRL